jgi:PAS domain S-box-containing protein
MKGVSSHDSPVAHAPIRRSAHEGASLPAMALAVVVLGVITWLAAPVLRHFPDALVPWPAHGLALAILLSARASDRNGLAIGMVIAVAIGAWVAGGTIPRAISAGAQLTAQTIVITLLYDRLTEGRHPLRGTIAYARFGVAILVGALPTTLLVALGLQIIGVEHVPGFTVQVWMIAAITSMAALTPVLLAPTAPRAIDARTAPLLSVEFLVLCVIYLLALLNAFLLLGAPWVELPPAVATVPFLAWAGMRFGVRGFAIVAFLFISVVVTSSITNIGPFQVFSPDVAVRGRRAWIYLASLIGPSMLFPVALRERSVAEERARGAFAQLSAILEGSGDLIAAVDRELTIIAANPAWVQGFEALTGIRSGPGERMDVVVRRGLPDDAEESIAFWKRALRGERFTVERYLGTHERGRVEYEITYSPVRDTEGVIVGASQVVRNVSDRRRREAEQQEYRRLESVGRLAGGVAHDFNNLMTAVIGYTELLAQSMPADDPRREDLAQIERAASRAGDLTQQLLAFARRRVIAPRIVDVGELVETFARLLSTLLGSNVLLSVRREPDLRSVRLDPAQFEQVVMNLAVNARDAMPGGGRLIIEVANALRGATKGVRLSVRDTGTGMAPEVQARLWEPFFTTKPQGQGTGLGLPTVHGIVHQAGGEITVESEIGRGSTFHVFLPEADASADPSTPT